jgi:hypothetical protein
MLAEIDGWFRGGFDAGDLKDAEALLDELSIGWSASRPASESLLP